MVISISLQMVIATTLGHKLGSVAMQERSVCENVPLLVTPKPQFRAPQDIRVKVEPVQRPGTDLYLDPGTRICEEQANGVARKMRWSAILEEIEAGREGDYSRAHPMNWDIGGG